MMFDDHLSARHERKPQISEYRRMELRRAGYRVEDMGAEYGPSFAGQWRFINLVTGDFQDVDTSGSECDAWHQAEMHARVVQDERS